MKKIIAVTILLSLILIFHNGCAAVVQSPVTGFVYTNLKYGLEVGTNAKSTKVGTAECKSFLGIVATGDASIKAACQNAGITKIHHVDVQVKSILGFFATYTIIVYGE